MRALTELQLSILQVLWRHGEAAASDVRRELNAEHRDLAPTSVATMLIRLESKGLVARRELGRVYFYRALVSQHEVRRSLIADLIEQAFGGDAAELVNHLVTSKSLDASELEHIRTIVEAEEQRRDGAE